jgi:hypothetical protein
VYLRRQRTLMQLEWEQAKHTVRLLETREGEISLLLDHLKGTRRSSRLLAILHMHHRVTRPFFVPCTHPSNSLTHLHVGPTTDVLGEGGEVDEEFLRPPAELVARDPTLQALRLRMQRLAQACSMVSVGERCCT